jgi:hypothetical protein
MPYAAGTVRDTVARGNITRPDRTRALTLCVLATTEAGTRAALRAAGVLGAGLDPLVLLFVPRPVPYQEPLEAPSASSAVATRRLRALAEQSALNVQLRVCLCRPDGASLATVFPREATVLVGGSSRRWLPTREQRLARRLTADGRRVLFIDSRRA